jgi:hypothetical protein
MTTKTGGAALKKSAIINDAVLEASKPKTKVREKQTDKLSANIAENSFYAVIFDTSKSAEERRDEITKLTTTTLNSKQDRASIKEFDEFREWLTSQQTEMAEQIIALSNIDSMAELQSVLNDMNTDLISFEDNMDPLMNIIESIHFLRTNGLMGDAFKEIQEDKEKEEIRQAELAKIQLEMEQNRQAVRQQAEVKVRAQAKRTWFGVGGISKEGLMEMARADNTIDESEKKNRELREQMEALKSKAPGGTALGEAEIHKTKLRELLDMSRSENQDNMIALRDSALNFISTARERTGALRGQFDGLSTQLEAVEDGNKNMTKVYAIMNDGMKGANKVNAEMRGTLVLPGDDESALDKLSREEKLQALDTHVGHLARSQGETMGAYGDLTQQAIRVHTMRTATDQQIQTARRINTEGVAATADRLATVMTAVSGAALGEASEAAKDTLNRMRQSTNEISSREVIRVAMGTSAVNDQLETVFQELEDIREVQQVATGITRNSMSEMQERMKALHKSASAAKDDLNDLIASASLTESGDEEAQKAAPVFKGFPGA